MIRINIYAIDCRTRSWTACNGGVVVNGCNKSIAWQAINNSIANTKE